MLNLRFRTLDKLATGCSGGCCRISAWSALWCMVAFGMSVPICNTRHMSS